MRHRSQGKLRGEARSGAGKAAARRPAALGWCLGLLAFGALACGEDPAAPAAQAPAAVIPDWSQTVCRNWQRWDGTCDQAALIADYEVCMQEGAAEVNRLLKAGVGNRRRLTGRERATNQCLERHKWVMTEEGRRNRIMTGGKQRAQPS